MGPEFILGGSLGGRPGFGFVASGGVLPSAPSLRPGGGGRFAVDSPVVSARNGSEGPFGLAASSATRWASSSSARCIVYISSFDKGAPKPRVSGVIWFGRAAPPW